MSNWLKTGFGRRGKIGGQRAGLHPWGLGRIPSEVEHRVAIVSDQPRGFARRDIGVRRSRRQRPPPGSRASAGCTRQLFAHSEPLAAGLAEVDVTLEHRLDVLERGVEIVAID